MKPDKRQRRRGESFYSDEYETVSQSYFDYGEESKFTDPRYIVNSSKNSLFDQHLEQDKSLKPSNRNGESDDDSFQYEAMELPKFPKNMSRRITAMNGHTPTNIYARREQ